MLTFKRLVYLHSFLVMSSDFGIRTMLAPPQNGLGTVLSFSLSGKSLCGIGIKLS